MEQQLTHIQPKSNDFRHAQLQSARRTFTKPKPSKRSIKKQPPTKMYDDPLDLHIDIWTAAATGTKSIQHLTKGIKQGHIDQTSPCFPNEAALHVAVTCGQHEIVELLLEHNCDVNVLDALGRTPLHRACRHGKVKIGLRLLETGKCNPSVRDVDGNTAYLLATKNPKSKEIADSLLFVSG